MKAHQKLKPTKHDSKLMSFLENKLEVDEELLLFNAYLITDGFSHEIDTWGLAKSLACDIRDLQNKLENLQEKEIIKRNDFNSFELTDKGLFFVKSSDWYVLHDLISELIQLIPEPIPILAQYFFTPNSAIRIVTQMKKDGSLKDKEVIALGSPIAGFAIAALGLSKKVTILDIDKTLLKAIELFSNNNGIVLSTLHHDLTKPLPPEEIEKYDTFVIDPVYTKNAYRCFLSRSLSALKRGTGQIGYVCIPKYILSNSHSLYEFVMKHVKKMGFEIEYVLRNIVETETPTFEKVTFERWYDLTNIKPWRVAELLCIKKTDLTTTINQDSCNENIYPMKEKWVILPQSVGNRIVASKIKNELLLITSENILYKFNESATIILFNLDKKTDKIVDILKNYFNTSHIDAMDIEFFIMKFKSLPILHLGLPRKLISKLELNFKDKSSGAYTIPSFEKEISTSVCSAKFDKWMER